MEELPAGLMAAGGEGGMPSAEEMQYQQQQMKAQEEQRLSILDQILTLESKNRLTRMALVKAEKARQIEDYLIKAASAGQLRNKVTEDELVALINQADAADKSKKSVTNLRRTYGGMDEDSDDNDDDLM